MPEPITTALATKIFSTVWQKFGKEISAEAKDLVKKKWNEFDLHNAEKDYRAKLIKLYGKMQIFGMTDSVPLDNIFVEVEILDKLTAQQRYDIQELLRRSTDPEKSARPNRLGGLSLVRENHNLFILGKPGAGKTTFLKRVVYMAAEQYVDKLPIFISLKEWSDSKLDLLPFIAKQFDICDFPEAMPFVEKFLKSMPSLVLFDGLDEVNQTDGQRDKQLLAMKEFIRKYDQAQCLITCRIAATDYTFEGFKYIEIADFSQPQIEQFVRNWFRQKEKTAKEFLEEFAKDENRNLRELASSPLLLTMLCLLYQETLSFPQRRAEIYGRAMDALLRRWDTSRDIKRDTIYRHLSLDHKEKMFAQVAAITFKKNEYFYPRKSLETHLKDYLLKVPPHEKDIDGELLLNSIVAQHGIFTERAAGIYSFSHLTFQEFFTAKYIADNAADGTLTELLKHCPDSRWREVFLLTTSLLSDAGKFLREFRTAVEDSIRQDAVTIELLEWVTQRRNASESKGVLAQEFYLWIGLRLRPYALDNISDFDFTRDHTLYLALDRDRTLDYALDYALELDHALEPDHALALDQSLALDHALAGALANARVPELNCNHAVELAVELALGLGLINLAEALRELLLATPVKSDPRDFLPRLRRITLQHRDIGHKRSFSPEETHRLIDYLNANRLLKDCLAVATMSPDEKEVILSHLFMPPTEVE